MDNRNRHTFHPFQQHAKHHITRYLMNALFTSELVDTERLMREGHEGGLSAANTTLVVVATNAKLSKVSATRLAKMAQAGVLRALSPGHTMGDGDIVIAISLGNEPSNLNALGVAAADVVGQAIVRGVKTAKTLGGVPGLAVP